MLVVRFARMVVSLGEGIRDAKHVGAPREERVQAGVNLR